MAKWTKRAAIERMNENQELQAVYARYPLARLLVESAAKLRKHSGYHRIACHYAYKDWMWAAIGHENASFWTCIHVIDDLLPPDNADIGEGVSRYNHNPRLPGLPNRPERAVQKTTTAADGRQVLKLYSIEELMKDNSDKVRHDEMRKTLEALRESHDKEVSH